MNICCLTEFIFLQTLPFKFFNDLEKYYVNFWNNKIDDTNICLVQACFSPLIIIFTLKYHVVDCSKCLYIFYYPTVIG